MKTYLEFREHMVHDNPIDFLNYLDEECVIADYLPIGRKCVIVDVFADKFADVIVEKLQDDFSTMADIIMYYEMYLVFDVLFRYTDIDFDVNYFNTMEYDLIMQSGFYHAVMRIAEFDYGKLKDMIDIVVGLKDLSILNLLNVKLNTPNVETAERISNIIEGIDPDKINRLAEIGRLNNPSLANLVSK